MDDQPVPQKATEFTIRAGAYVLACGAVANARQLLLSNAGNEHDQVGRNFMCHPLTTITAVSAARYLTPSENRFMNGQTTNGVGWRDANGVGVTGRFSPNAEEQLKHGIGSCWFWPGAGRYYYEMSPNPDSRVTLADTLDPVFGQRQTKITWHLGPLDQKTYEKATELFEKAVKAVSAGRGTVSFLSWDDITSHLVVNGHHIGTTRMSDDPTQGVVDANLKVHGLANLYVAGSSVFASTGISNPTFTIITLSIRLAKYLTGTNLRDIA
jgi:choline dehydrogenase-like flavoprotein